MITNHRDKGTRNVFVDIVVGEIGCDGLDNNTQKKTVSRENTLCAIQFYKMYVIRMIKALRKWVAFFPCRRLQLQNKYPCF